MVRQCNAPRPVKLYKVSWVEFQLWLAPLIDQPLKSRRLSSYAVAVAINLLFFILVLVSGRINVLKWWRFCFRCAICEKWGESECTWWCYRSQSYFKAVWYSRWHCHSELYRFVERLNWMWQHCQGRWKFNKITTYSSYCFEYSSLSTWASCI